MSKTKIRFDLDPETFVRHFTLGIVAVKQAWVYIKDNRLWDGFWEYGWVSKLLMLGGLIVGGTYFNVYLEWLRGPESESVLQSVVSTGALVQDFARESYDMFYNGSMKYLILVLMEVFIFHVVRRCFEMISGKEMDSSFEAFVQAQIRMLKVILKCWILEMVLTIVISAALGIFGLNFIKPVLVFIIQCYFLGFAVIDNYYEMFEMTIRQSEQETREIPGLALSIGIIVWVLMMIPLVGAVIGPLIGAVAATLALYKMNPNRITYASNEPLMSA